ncbi:hypothetical protein N657DRAFT_198670 [Parathielavia appendiculata]|uniref:Uncharacterized protein n=1 Tax=Parathielavia appendiculata TaxID=2587402 RepID=A0AAN6Z790_9PEZI|nr:hypothetical protein N657DRAFT_198670 [Parathielavia appendiculata]
MVGARFCFSTFYFCNVLRNTRRPGDFVTLHQSLAPFLAGLDRTSRTGRPRNKDIVPEATLVVGHGKYQTAAFRLGHFVFLVCLPVLRVSLLDELPMGTELASGWDVSRRSG